MLTDPAAIPKIFGLATHEAFHFFPQKKWSRDTSNTTASRATPYPLLVEPRLARNQVIRALEAATFGMQDGLGHASYWYKKWKEDHPAEATNIKHYDISEGSAEYIETVANIVAQGYVFGSPQYQTAMTEEIRKGSNKTTQSIDQESYRIGLLSGNLLDRKGTEWKTRIENGERPLDILLSNTPPIPESADPVLEHELRTSIENENTQIQKSIGPFIQAFRGINTGKLFVPFSKFSGSTIYHGNYALADFSHEIQVKFSVQAHPTNGTLNAKSTTVAFVSGNSYCSEPGGILIILPDGMPSPINGRLQIESSQLSIDAPYPSLDSSGSVYCLR